MEKVFALCRSTLLNRKRNEWSCYRTLDIYANFHDAYEKCMNLRQQALDNHDNTVDYRVVEFNVL